MRKQEDDLRAFVLGRLQHAYFNHATDVIAKENGVISGFKHVPVVLENYADEILDEARKKVASEIFNLAHTFSNEDQTPHSELQAWHYYAAIHTVGKFEGR